MGSEGLHWSEHTELLVFPHEPCGLQPKNRTRNSNRTFRFSAHQAVPENAPKKLCVSIRGPFGLLLKWPRGRDPSGYLKKALKMTYIWQATRSDRPLALPLSIAGCLSLFFNPQYKSVTVVGVCASYAGSYCSWVRSARRTARRWRVYGRYVGCGERLGSPVSLLSTRSLRTERGWRL